MGASENVIPYAHDYMKYILIGMFFQTFAMCQQSLIRAEGNATVPMVGMIIGAGLNIILDAVFIIPLGMGVKGAALATILAQLVSVIYFMVYYFGGKSYLKIHMRNLMPDWQIVKDIMVIGVSAFAMMLAGSITSVLMNRVLLAYGGDIAISAFGVVHRLMAFAMMPGAVIGQGVQPIVGFNYGARRYDRALKAIKIASIYATFFGVVGFLVIFIWPQLFVNIFTTDSELVALSSYAARRLLAGMPLVGVMMVGSMVFVAMGKAVEAFVTSLARSALFLLPLIYLLPYFWQLDGIWLAQPISDLLTSVLTVILIIPMIARMRRGTAPQSYPSFSAELPGS
jgi:putative MATE family efflux protein